MTQPLHILAPLALASLLSACCAKDLVVVLPGSGGQVGGVVVETGRNRMVLDKAYAGARPGSGAGKTIKVSEDEVERVFSQALAARPIPARSYTLYFENGRNQIVPESRAVLDAMLAEISQRKAVEVVITGHTDTMGSADDNDRLSLNRARAVEHQLEDTLKAKGVQSESVKSVGRGERELLVRTADQTAERRNRRVEITVR